MLFETRLAWLASWIEKARTGSMIVVMSSRFGNKGVLRNVRTVSTNSRAREVAVPERHEHGPGQGQDDDEQRVLGTCNMNNTDFDGDEVWMCKPMSRDATKEVGREWERVWNASGVMSISERM